MIPNYRLRVNPFTFAPKYGIMEGWRPIAGGRSGAGRPGTALGQHPREGGGRRSACAAGSYLPGELAAAITARCSRPAIHQLSAARPQTHPPAFPPCLPNHLSLPMSGAPYPDCDVVVDVDVVVGAVVATVVVVDDAAGMVRSMCQVVFRSILIGNWSLDQIRSHGLLAGISVASESRTVWTLAGVSVGQNRNNVLSGSSWSSMAGVARRRGPRRYTLILFTV